LWVSYFCENKDIDVIKIKNGINSFIVGFMIFVYFLSYKNETIKNINAITSEIRPNKNDFNS
jgi:hypothetical protein